MTTKTDSTKAPRVLVTRQIPAAGLKVLEGKVEYEVLAERWPPPREQLIAAVSRGWQGILATLTEQIDEAVIAACPGLRVVANMAVGYDNVDVAAATDRGVVVTNTPGVLTDTTADFAWTLLLAAARCLPAAQKYLRDGSWRTWEPEALLGQEVSGATLGIIGMGRIGAAMAKRARGFDMRVFYHDPVPRLGIAREVGASYRDLPDLLREADFISVHVPLTPETRHLIGPAQLKMMRPTAVLVNTARGPVVDQRALYEALRDGEIFAAGIDVYDQEPLPLDDPLLTLDNVVLTPHVASATVATRGRMAALAAENAVAAVRGTRPQHLVNPAAWGKELRGM